MELKRLSEYFGIDKAVFAASGAFDSVIGQDAEFFVDPLLLKTTSVPEFAGAIEKVKKYFNDVIILVSAGTKETNAKALRMLQFREIRGIGIGYSKKSDSGSAIGPDLAAQLLTTTRQLLRLGIKSPDIFNVMGLFESGFGPDRLSDTAISILKKEIYEYTSRVAEELGIPRTRLIRDYERNHLVPEHPNRPGQPLLLIPQKLLRDLPVVVEYDQIYEAAAFNDAVRAQFNSILAPLWSNRKDPPTKKEIKSFLLADEERFALLLAAYQSATAKPYDFVNDPAGLNTWLEKGRGIAAENPIDTKITEEHTVEDLEAVVYEVVEAFRKFIEHKGGWKLLYHRGRALNERFARLAFYATAIIQCEKYGIDVSPESDAGSGPVDFKFSVGADKKIIVEVKLTKGNVRQGYEVQTRAYADSEQAHASIYIVIQVTETSAALDEILKREEDEEKRGLKHPRIVPIDGRHKEPASKREKAR